VFSLSTGVALLLFGAAVAMVSARHFHNIAKSFDASEPEHRLRLGVATDVVVALVALVLAGHVLWISTHAVDQVKGPALDGDLIFTGATAYSSQPLDMAFGVRGCP
jgi:hypothetical protein